MRIYICILIACSFLNCSDRRPNKEYYLTGELKIITIEFENNTICSKKYYKSGVIMREACSTKDLLEGEFISYYENGNPEYKIDYKKGVQNGKAIYYSEEGNLTEEKFLLEGINYYSIFYDSLGQVTRDITRPIVTSTGQMESNHLSKIEVYIPFIFEIDLPYINKEISVLWNFSKEEGSSEFHFHEQKDSVIHFSHMVQTKSIEVAPRDTGKYYINLLVYHNIRDSLFEFSSTAFNVK